MEKTEIADRELEEGELLFKTENHMENGDNE